MNGGQLIAEVLVKQGVKYLFTLSGGHIAPIFVEAKKAGVRIVDVRHEVNTVFAADAVARLSGVPGVATVTAGPGVTNTVTAVKNAQMAQSPIVILGGAAATILKGRGSLQDIDQISVLKSIVKWAASVQTVKDLVPAVEKAFKIAKEGTPGPVFVECPIDLLFDESIVRDWYTKDFDKPARNLQEKAMRWYINRHLNKVFKDKDKNRAVQADKEAPYPKHNASQVTKAANQLKNAKKPLMLIGSQTVLNPAKLDKLVEAIESINIPVYLSGMARGLLGKNHPLQMRHKRRNALKDADLVLLSGVPCDFRLDYGRHIRGGSMFISVNRSREDLMLNKRPKLPVLADPCDFLVALGTEMKSQAADVYDEWKNHLGARDMEREEDIDTQAQEEFESGINPLRLFRELDPMLADESILVADGGDFVGTAAYTLKPRGPLTWLDPGVFGTLGVGGGFAMGAKLVKPDSEVWIIWGDGSSAYSIAEFDTYTRLGIPVIGLIGNDASWAQIARDQVEMLGDDVASVLAYCDYDVVAKGYGADGMRVENIREFKEAVARAKESVKNGRSFLINAVIGKSDFRKGSISV